MNLDSLADCPAVPRLPQRVGVNPEGVWVSLDHDTNMRRVGLERQGESLAALFKLAHYP
jgi:hypothetical protein